MGAFWDPFWRQNRPKICPRCTSKPYLLQKHEFHGTLIKHLKFNDFCPEDRPPNGPRRSQDGSKMDLKAFTFYHDFYARFWFILSSILGPSGGPFRDLFGSIFGSEFWIPFWSLWGALGSPLGSRLGSILGPNLVPKLVPKRPSKRTPSRRPFSTKIWSKSGPRPPKKC